MPTARASHEKSRSAAEAITAISSGRGIRHCSNRLFEWMTAAMMLGIAATIAASPQSIAGGGFYLMGNLGLTPAVLVALFCAAGIARAAGLYANGHWPVYGPWCRALGAFGGVFIWAQMFLSLVKWSSQSGYISIGVPVYFFLTFGELISCYRAARDGRAVSRCCRARSHSGRSSAAP
jgi:hypothetical protein